MNSKLRGVKRVGPDGRPSQKQRRLSSKNLCSVLEVTTTKHPQAGDGLAFLHDRLVEAVVEVEATTTSSRNMNKFCVPEEIRQMVSDAAKCRDPVRRKHLRKIAHRARHEFEAGKAVLPKSKVMNRLVVTKLWVNGLASEDRDEWTEGFRAHCERCCDDRAETPEVQAESRGSVVIDL